jgi:hypothetical protein
MGKGAGMKAGLIITGSGSMLALTSTDSFEDPVLVRALMEKGINKYIAFEVPDDLVKSRYGQHYFVTLADRRQSDILRIVDVDGQRIFRNFDLGTLSRPTFHEEPAAIQRAA